MKIPHQIEGKLKKRKRRDLLEQLLEVSKENELLKRELESAKSELADRKIQLEKTGSIAYAALEINGVFESTQNAADQYLENIKRLEEEALERSEVLIHEAELKAVNIISNAEKKADFLLRDAIRTAEECRIHILQKLDDFVLLHPELKELLDIMEHDCFLVSEISHTEWMENREKE